MFVFSSHPIPDSVYQKIFDGQDWRPPQQRFPLEVDGAAGSRRIAAAEVIENAARDDSDVGQGGSDEGERDGVIVDEPDDGVDEVLEQHLERHLFPLSPPAGAPPPAIPCHHHLHQQFQRHEGQGKQHVSLAGLLVLVSQLLHRFSLGRLDFEPFAFSTNLQRRVSFVADGSATGSMVLLMLLCAWLGHGACQHLIASRQRQ